MSSVSDLIENNPYYDEGLFFDKNIFKNSLKNASTSSFVPQETIDKFYKMVLISEAIQLISGYALSMMSWKEIGTPAWLGISAASFLGTISRDSSKDNAKSYGFFERLNYKAKILAAGEKKQSIKILSKELTISSAIKIIAALGMKISQLTKPLAYLVMTIQSHNSAKIFEEQLLSWVSYFAKKSHLELEAQC